MNKSFLKKCALVGAGLAIALVSCIATALVMNTYVHQSESKEFDFEKGHTTEVLLSAMDVDSLISPGENRTLSCTMRNGSNTDKAYIFVDVETVPGVWSVEPGNGWTRVGESDVFALANGGNMTAVDCGQSVSFNATMTVAATGSAYQQLVKNDLKVKVTAMAINTAASREAISDSFADYGSGGNADKIEALEQV